MHLVKQPLPKEIKFMIREGILPEKTEVYLLDYNTVIFSKESWGKGQERLHASIAHPFRLPAWEEVKFVRYTLFPDEMTVAQILPPKSEYVDMHKNCFHLWELKKEEICRDSQREEGTGAQEKTGNNPEVEETEQTKVP